MPGYIYVLVNGSMPGRVKIGKTTRPPERRARELSHPSGIPEPFKVAFSVRVSDCNEAEAVIHKRLRQYRLRGKEFFVLSVSEAIAHVQAIVSDPRFAPESTRVPKATEQRSNVTTQKPGRAETENSPSAWVTRPRDPLDQPRSERDRLQSLAFTGDREAAKKLIPIEEARGDENMAFRMRKIAFHPQDPELCFWFGRFYDRDHKLPAAAAFYTLATEGGQAEANLFLNAIETLFPQSQIGEFRGKVKFLTEQLKKGRWID